jgi:hypothetical protein
MIRPSSKPTAPNNGAINVVLFFFQLAQVAVPAGQDNMAAGAYAILGGFFSMQQPQSSSDTGTCIATGTTMFHVMVWELVAPLMPVIFLLFMYSLYSVALQRPSGKFTVGGDHDDPATEELLLKEQTLSPGRSSPTNNLRSFASAVAGLCILGYTSLSQAALKLLRCTPIDGQSVLYFAGTTICSGHHLPWQVFVMIALAVLVVLPLLPVCVWLLRYLPIAPVNQWARSQQWPKLFVMQAIRRSASEPFSKEHAHFAAVLVLQVLQ